MIYKKYIKIFFDFTSSIFVLIFFSPIIFLICLSILLVDGLPVIFTQDRIGKKCKIFKIYKFRTLSKDGKEIKFIGNFLRKTKLDEILNFINVFFNEMSVVGPRPLKLDYLKNYSKTQIKRHNVKPGIFGLAQMQDTNITWKKYFQLDLYYIRNYSFNLDIWIILICIKNIILSKLRYKTLDKDQRFNSKD